MATTISTICNKIVEVVGVDVLMILLPTFIFYPMMALCGVDAMKYKRSKQTYSMDGDA